jgi:proteasome lid subunit RPN8/RPN11
MLILDFTQVQLIFEEARKCYPKECCGILLGEQLLSGERRVISVIPVPNVAKDPMLHFKVSAEDFLNVEFLADASCHQIIGVYHTHADCGMAASQEDAAYAVPNMSYPIVSVVDGLVAGLCSWEKKDRDDSKNLIRESVKIR